MRNLAPARVSHRGDFSKRNRVYMQAHHMLIKYRRESKLQIYGFTEEKQACSIRSSSQGGNFTPERVIVSRLHDTVARFRAGTNFSLRCCNRGEFAPERHFLVVSCKQLQS